MPSWNSTVYFLPLFLCLLPPHRKLKLPFDKPAVNLNVRNFYIISIRSLFHSWNTLAIHFRWEWSPAGLRILGCLSRRRVSKIYRGRPGEPLRILARGAFFRVPFLRTQERYLGFGAKPRFWKDKCYIHPREFSKRCIALEIIDSIFTKFAHTSWHIHVSLSFLQPINSLFWICN